MKIKNMNIQMDIMDLFIAQGALLKGHFLLSSGLHSDQYMQSALLLQNPAVASQMGEQLAGKFPGNVDAVISPAIGGLIIGHEVARAKGCRAIFSEKDDQGKPVLRRGFQMNPKEKILVIEDVITTGLSTSEVIGLVEKSGAEVVGVGSIVNRSGKINEQLAKWKDKVQSLLNLEVKQWTAGECHLCKQGSVPVKPGSRKMTA